MHRARLFAPDLIRYPEGQPLLVTWYDDGLRAGLGYHVPSMRTDIIKIQVTPIAGGQTKEMRLHELPTHDLSDGRTTYELYEPNDREMTSLRRVADRMGIQV